MQINVWQENIGLQVTPTVSPGIAANDPVNTGATALFDTVNFPNSTVAQRTEAAALELRANLLNAFTVQNILVGSAANEVNSGVIDSAFGQTRSAYRDFTVSGTNDPGGRLIEFQLRLSF